MRLGTPGSADKVGVQQEIFVDINGAQGPNIRCRDLFKLTVSNNGEINGACVNNLIQKGWVMDADYDSTAGQT